MSEITLHLGDCLDVMRSMPDGCVDAVVCDPPYGLSFMGKGWDHGVPGVEFWVEALRVAKPGAHLLAFGGTRTYHRLACAIEDAGWRIVDCLSWLYGSGFPKHKSLLKPAWEPVVMAAKAGRRVVNIEKCRLSPGDGIERDGERTAEERYGARGLGFQPKPGIRGGSALGRWPANVMLDEAAAAVLDEQSGTLTSGGGDKSSFIGYRGGANGGGPRVTERDSGGASRFMYVAKASRAEREAGCESLPVRDLARGNAAQSAVDRGESIERESVTSGLGATYRVRNHHPTVKPVALMRWLVRLVTPPGGLVLDPFTGSGTTALACIAEGRAFVGAEREPEYHAIAEARIAHARGETLPSDEQRGLDFGGAA